MTEWTALRVAEAEAQKREATEATMKTIEAEALQATVTANDAAEALAAKVLLLLLPPVLLHALSPCFKGAIKVRQLDDSYLSVLCLTC